MIFITYRCSEVFLTVPRVPGDLTKDNERYLSFSSGVVLLWVEGFVLDDLSVILRKYEIAIVPLISNQLTKC